MKTSLKNVFTSVLPQGINIIVNLILPSLIIANFGSEINGLTSTARTIVSYISLVGAGIATSTTQALYAPVALKDTKSIKGMLNSTNKMFKRQGIIYCGIALIISIIYPFVLSSDLSKTTISAVVLVVTLAGASEFFSIGRCRSLLYANQKVYVCNIIQALSILIGNALAVLLIYFKVSIIFVQLSITSVYILRGIFLSLYVYKKYPQLRDFRKETPIAKAVEKRSDAMVHQIAGVIAVCGQTIILSVFVGLEAASIYAVYNVVFTGLQTIFANVLGALTPMLGKQIALRNDNRLKTIYSKIEFLAISGASVVYLASMVLILPFVKLYTMNADINYQYPIFAVLFTLASAFYVLKLPTTSLINAAGHFKETKYKAIIEAGISIVLGVPLTLMLGINGVVVSMLIGQVWRCFDNNVYVYKNILHIRCAKAILDIIRATVLILLGGIFVFFIKLNIFSWKSWVVNAIFITVGAIFILLITTLIFDRKRLLSFFKLK